jgi:hypothetical protein
MRTDELIADLAAELKPTPPGALRIMLLTGLLIGGAAALVLMLSWLGLRPDLAVAARAAPFWMKAGYTLLLMLAGFALVDRLGRPGASGRKAVVLILAIAFAMLATGLAQFLMATPAVRPALFFGDSFAVCGPRIAVISAPVLVALFLALRRMAPTRPALAGAAGGLLAGAAGASVYGLHCGESSALFIAVWYSLGIGAVSAVGALCGRLALRW